MRVRQKRHGWTCVIASRWTGICSIEEKQYSDIRPQSRLVDTSMKTRSPISFLFLSRLLCCAVCLLACRPEALTAQTSSVGPRSSAEAVGSLQATGEVRLNGMQAAPEQSVY